MHPFVAWEPPRSRAGWRHLPHLPNLYTFVRSRSLLLFVFSTKSGRSKSPITVIVIARVRLLKEAFEHMIVLNMDVMRLLVLRMIIIRNWPCAL